MFDCFWLSVPVQLIAWKDSSPNDLLRVELDVKPYTLTHLDLNQTRVHIFEDLDLNLMTCWTWIFSYFAGSQ